MEVLDSLSVIVDKLESFLFFGGLKSLLLGAIFRIADLMLGFQFFKHRFLNVGVIVVVILLVEVVLELVKHLLPVDHRLQGDHVRFSHMH